MNVYVIATANRPHSMATLQGLIHALLVNKHPRNIHYRIMLNNIAVLTGSG